MNLSPGWQGTRDSGPQLEASGASDPGSVVGPLGEREGRHLVWFCSRWFFPSSYLFIETYGQLQGAPGLVCFSGSLHSHTLSPLYWLPARHLPLPARPVCVPCSLPAAPAATLPGHLAWLPPERVSYVCTSVVPSGSCPLMCGSALGFYS